EGLDNQAGQQSRGHSTDQDVILHREFDFHLTLADSADIRHDESGTLRRDRMNVKPTAKFGTRNLEGVRTGVLGGCPGRRAR
ncbi:MAG: hypothetical protein KGJ82_18335, partial [Nitrospirota bacterium]|nr:hypothetical protein [Nitrospirota bacterium]